MAHDRRVTTVEEQQTQEDMEDEDSSRRNFYEMLDTNNNRESMRDYCAVAAPIKEEEDSNLSSNESMPEDVSESDNQATLKANIPAGQFKTTDDMYTSKLSTPSPGKLKNSKQKSDNILTEEFNEECLENVSDENEELHQSCLPHCDALGF